MLFLLLLTTFYWVLLTKVRLGGLVLLIRCLVSPQLLFYLLFIDHTLLNYLPRWGWENFYSQPAVLFAFIDHILLTSFSLKWGWQDLYSQPVVIFAVYWPCFIEQLLTKVRMEKFVFPTRCLVCFLFAVYWPHFIEVTSNVRMAEFVFPARCLVCFLSAGFWPHFIEVSSKVRLEKFVFPSRCLVSPQLLPLQLGIA